jgi:hypothetical protein
VTEDKIREEQDNSLRRVGQSALHVLSLAALGLPRP